MRAWRCGNTSAACPRASHSPTSASTMGGCSHAACRLARAASTRPCRSSKTKTNEVEARALVSYLAQALSEHGELRLRDATVGVISLGGLEQARLLRSLLLDALSDAQLARHRVVVGDAAAFQGDERDVILLSMVASPSSASPHLGRAYEQKYNVALSRARDRMVLFRSLAAKDVTNADDLKRWTMAFFASGGAPAHLGSARVAVAAAHTPEGQLERWLSEQGFRFSSECSVAGSVVVVEDAADDRRLCVCLDGGAGGTLSEYRAQLREQRSLERAGWRFARVWRASFLVDVVRALREIARALDAAGVRPAELGAAPLGGDAPMLLQPLETLAKSSQPAQPAPRKRKAPAAAFKRTGSAGAEAIDLSGDADADADAGADAPAPARVVKGKGKAKAARTALASTSDASPQPQPAKAAAKKPARGKKTQESDSEWEP
mmetsp:Transcript_29332/g.72288  ORF Transcript_29332/g.72288 Transcript_29332/m.72288 type:complete len:435 (-) Transcript_29332:111-1415(-)